MEKKDKLEAMKNLDFSFRTKPFKGRHVMTVENLTFGYEGQQPLIKDLNFSVGPGDRICVVGKNGKGKTTLLKLLAGTLTPQSGSMAYNPNIVTGFYEQTNIKTLVDSRTVAEEILYSDAGVDQQMARNIAGAMMFEGDSALKKISVLSGGEKARVMLGKLLATPVNLLLLDEPTNHLDMDSCDALLEAIDNFDGVVIMVTHNEMFLHALARRLIVFQNDEVYMFEGTYNRFLEKGGWQDDEKGGPSVHQSKAEVRAETVSDAPRMNKKELRKLRSEIVSERGKVTKPIEKKIARAEDDIVVQEKEIERINARMLEASQAGDGQKIAKLSQTIHNCQTIIDKRFEEMEKLTAELEAHNAVFDQRLAELGGDGE